jgi:hypothetical protein
MNEAREVLERAAHRRAVEAVIWGMPAVNYDRMYQAMVREVKGGFNEIAYSVRWCSRFHPPTRVPSQEP